MRRLLCGLIVLGLLAGCSTEVEGPEPAMDAEPDELLTDPSFVCNEAHPDEGTWVELDGEAFSPLVVDAIASERDPDVELPVATLILRQGPAGEEVDEQRYELDSPLGEEAGEIRWLDDETLQFRVDDELDLAEGVYDIEVENPNGQVASETEAFGVLDRPELHTAIPEMTCVAQGEREIVLEGDNLLVQGDEDEVPTVDLDGEEVEVVEDSTTDCRELHNTFTDHQICEELTVRIDEQQLEAGVYDVTATNFAPAGCPSIPEEDGVVVTVNDPPEVHDIEPSPVCSEQIQYTGMEVDGDEFITVQDEGETVYPEVAVGERTYRAVDATGCEDVESTEALGAQRCDQLLIDVEDGDLADQVSDDTTHEDLHVVATNPEPVGCHSTQDEYLTAMPRPQVDLVEPDPMCTAQYENTFRIEGHGFAEIDGNQPVVHIGEDETYEVEADDLAGCTDIDTPDVPTASCDELSVTIPEGDLEVERNDVTVENPETAGCESTDDSTVQVVPPPTVTSVSPQPICAETDTRTLEIDGEDFLDIDGDLPEVAIGGEQLGADSLGGECDELPLDDEDRSVEVCDTLLVDVDPSAELEADVHDVVVTNPEPAQCHSEEDDVTFETVPPPEVDSVDPRAFCSESGDEIFDIRGDYFYEIDGEAPDVRLGNTTWTDVEVVEADCGELNDDDIRRCETLELTADSDSIGEDHHDLVVVNHYPVGCQSEQFEPMVAAGPPEITEATPSGLCEGDTFDDEIELAGSFLRDADADDEEELPTVTMIGHEDEERYTASVLDMDNCSETDLDEWVLEDCAELDASVPEDVREQGFDVEVDAPDPVACGADTEPVPRTPTPQIDSIEPATRICVEGGHFEVRGSDLHEDAEAYLDDVQATDVEVGEDEDGEYADVYFDGDLERPEMTFRFVNPGECGAEEEKEITVEEAPIPLYVDPPATFAGMDTQVTIYAAGVGDTNIETVELVHPADGSTTELSVDDTDNPYIVQATVEEGMLEEDEQSVDFGVRITDDFSCESETVELLTITSEPTIALDEIRPPFGTEDEDTSVTITAHDELDDDEVHFESTPRAYLNPSQIEGDVDVAQELGSVEYIDETQLNGLVSAGLPLGTYDLIVVNPDGAVGVLEEAFEIVDEHPPLVDGVSPGNWSNDEDEIDVDVDGQHFRDTPEVEVFCQQVDEDLDEEDMRNPDITVEDFDDDFIDLEVDATDLNHLDVCFMRVTNPDETWGEYSPITATNPGDNFMMFNAGTDFEIPRRAPTVLAGEPARMARYLYVVGGDDGAVEDDVFSHGEVAPIDRFGAPGQWRDMRYEIPRGRTLAEGVRVGDFVYVVGGADESGMAVPHIHRARVLDPDEAPDITGLDLTYDEDAFDEEDGPDAEDGLEAGLYYYRVAATYGGDDPANPDGESLGSDPQPVNVPLDGAEVTIEWEEPSQMINQEIDGYRVYRSVNPDDVYGDEELLAEVDAETFSIDDDGSETPSGDAPLSIGALGTWDEFGQLDEPRMRHGVSWIDNPEDEDEHFVYAVAGETDGQLRSDYELFSIEVDGPREQSLGVEPDVGDAELPEGRADLQAQIAHGGNAPSVADVRPQLFVTGGETDGGGDEDAVFVTTIGESGHIDDWTELTATNSDRVGHAGLVANNTLIVAGGLNGPHAGARNAEIECDTGDGCPPAWLGEDDDEPGGGGGAAIWTDLGTSMSDARIFMGHMPFRGFWYVGGGLGDGDEPLESVDYSPIGGTE